MSEELLKEKQERTKEAELALADVSDRTKVETSGQLEDETDNSEEMKKVLARVIEQEFSGPIPPPNIIAGYENAIPGSADRIIRMAEQQSSHRQQMELMEIKAEARDSLLGVIFAFGLGMGCLAACIIMVVMVPVAAGAICGSILGVTGIASIVTAFLKNTRRSDK